MPLPAIIDAAQDYLFADRDKMVEAGLPAPTIEHIIRLRDCYDYWLAHPSKRDRDIVARFIACGHISKPQAYADLKILKHLLGAMQQASKDYYRYQVIQMLNASYEMARAAGNTRDMIAAADRLGKYTHLDKDDEQTAPEMPLQTFEATYDPTVAGYKPLPNLRERIKKLKEQYWSEDVEDVTFDVVDFNEDDIFKPKKDG